MYLLLFYTHNFEAAKIVNSTHESTLKIFHFHKMEYFDLDFHFLKFSDTLVSVNLTKK